MWAEIRNDSIDINRYRRRSTKPAINSWPKKRMDIICHGAGRGYNIRYVDECG